MELIDKGLVLLNLEAATKGEVIRTLAGRMQEAGRLADEEGYVEAVFAREREFATAMGYSVAIPHGKTDAVKVPSLAFARLKDDVQWSDDEAVRYVFMIAVPEAAAGDLHLRILAALSRQLIHEDFCQGLEQMATPEEVVGMIGDLEGGLSNG